MKIWEVLNVATVDGGIIVRDLVVQKNPNNPINPTPRVIPMVDKGISVTCGVKNRSFSSKIWHSPEITKPPHPM